VFAILAVYALVVGQGKKDAFFSGFYGVAIPWMLLSAYINMSSDSILTFRILQLFSMPQFGVLLIIITGLVGGISGGIGTLSAGWIKALKTKK
ncbi:hypothetical protein ACFLR1_06470, partial [Bacteroidota bacterium]